MHSDDDSMNSRKVTKDPASPCPIPPRRLYRGATHAPRRLLAAAAAVVLFATAAFPGDVPRPVATKERRLATWEGRLYLRVPVPRRNGLSSVAKKYTGKTSNARLIKKATPHNRGRRIVEARVPFRLLLPQYRTEVLSALFPEDRRVEGGWEHRWKEGPLAKWETWGSLCSWFTGSSRNVTKVRKANGMRDRNPARGQTVLISDDLLWKPIRELPPPPPPVDGGPGLPPGPGGEAMTVPEAGSPAGDPPRPAAPESDSARTEGAFPLEYGEDGDGGYAVYRLKPGEALYSAVAVRFTGRINAADVNEMARKIADRSKIRDVTDIPVGFPVKIPLEELSPWFLPKDDLRYREWEANRQEAEKYVNTFKTSALEGVVVILDAGHGGADRGAIKNGVWEDSYVYDIACRIHQGLERTTKARVLMTLHNPYLGYRPVDKEKLEPNKEAVILTHPWLQPRTKDHTRDAVNLRWYLTNSYFLRLKKEGIEPDRVVFTSVHADSLHSSIQGAMIYVPGKPYRKTRWSVNRSSYKKYEEYKKNPSFKVTQKDLVRSEGLSRQFATSLERSFKKHGIRMHSYSPTRNHVVRGKRSWVPAVLRYNIVPCSILLEVCNINNKKDANRLKDPEFRKKVADAYIEALIRYYS